ncbi:hypothetical protein [Polynucleobacter sp. MWH-Braz-FAM2G]|uniref:hypothetical protein n=1 Tax=Polynucleobacter sp. MWH-Braz-FAM2G TaxID=1855883 RepID=UPI001BFD5E90|nr:hypothetical protein [Polynucleobacter sp. MWH-Braz-FAM2G]QWD91778.1 hypothetical protein FD973_05550 [Polynucleobacter sp. MWH-Braz-FAM2G]
MLKEKILLTEISEWRKSVQEIISKLENQISDEQKRSPNRKSKLQKNLEQELELYMPYYDFLNSDNPALLFFDAQKRNQAKEAMKIGIAKLPQDELIDLFADLIIENSNLKQIASFLGRDKLTITKKLETVHINNLNKVASQTKGLNDRYEKNHLALKECLELMKSKSNVAINPADYIRFRTLVIKTYPTPPVIPAYKRNKQEMLQSEDLQKANAQSGNRLKWSESTLRAFFEKHTGVKPSSVRK